MVRLAVGLAVAWLLALALTPATAAAEPERFALLVGVDDQLQNPKYQVTVLRGPSNDVKIVQRLLVEQYDFRNDGKHIVVLTGKAATAGAIEQAFKAHLIENAKANKDAVIVFYFSGHGSTVRDKNGDEGDSIDETLVAYDSRGPDGFDIIDDTIDSWFEGLRAHTSNVTFILDSCHSGTATRGDSVARELPPNPNMDPPDKPRSLTQDSSPELLRNQQYTAVAGSRANQTSHEGSIKAANGAIYGYMTWTLVQTLKLRPELSWEEVEGQLRAGVAEYAPAQQPQIEGDRNRIAFGGIGDRFQAYIKIIRFEGGDKLVVGAGEANSLGVGSLLGIYDPKARLLKGEEHRLATARVTEVSMSSARAVLVTTRAKPLPADAKVTILQAYSREGPLNVRLDTLPDQPTSTADAKVLAAVRTEVAKNGNVQMSGGTGPWLFALQRGCLNANGRLEPTGPKGPRVGCPSAYYLAPRQTREPALAYWVAASDPQLASKLADGVAALERQARLRALESGASSVRVGLRLLDVAVIQGPLGQPEPRATPRALDKGLGVAVGDRYAFDIENRSDKDIYATLLVLGTSGAIHIITPSANGELVKAKTTMRLLPPVLRAGPPPGIETYKIIATTRSDMDFRTYEGAGVRTKDPAKEDMQVNEWTTAQLDLQVRAAPTEP